MGACLRVPIAAAKDWGHALDTLGALGDLGEGGGDKNRRGGWVPGRAVVAPHLTAPRSSTRDPERGWRPRVLLCSTSLTTADSVQLRAVDADLLQAPTQFSSR